MKKLIFILCLASCGVEPQGEREDSGDGYNVVTIDSCQYIEVKYLLGTQNGYYSLTHKGNCVNHKTKSK